MLSVTDVQTDPNDKKASPLRKSTQHFCGDCIFSRSGISWEGVWSMYRYPPQNSYKPSLNLKEISLYRKKTKLVQWLARSFETHINTDILLLFNKHILFQTMITPRPADPGTNANNIKLNMTIRYIQTNHMCRVASLQFIN